VYSDGHIKRLNEMSVSKGLKFRTLARLPTGNKNGSGTLRNAGNGYYDTIHHTGINST
jgi:hypothetical protein